MAGRQWMCESDTQKKDLGEIHEFGRQRHKNPWRLVISAREGESEREGPRTRFEEPPS